MATWKRSPLTRRPARSGPRIGSAARSRRPSLLRSRNGMGRSARGGRNTPKRSRSASTADNPRTTTSGDCSRCWGSDVGEVKMTLRELPSVDEVVLRLGAIGAPRSLIVTETRRVLAKMRSAILEGREPGDADARVTRNLAALAQPSLRRVINATGLILHTNLGRAPTAPFTPLEGYSNLEYDLIQGRRGKRDAHVSPLLERLAGKPGIAVNNNAAAVLLTLHELSRC